MGLMERRALEAAFRELAETTNYAQQVERAEAIAQHGSAALPVLLAMLDTEDPQLRGGLGQVAARLERTLVAPALRLAARARDRSEAARLTALTILDRYLHEAPDSELLSALQDPRAMARQSLRELMLEMERSEFAVVEYLTQLAEQPLDVPDMLLAAIPEMPAHEHLVTLLRMFAQGQKPIAAQKALDLLGRTRMPAAAQALAALTQTLPPERAALAERNLRKLRLSGVAVTPPSAEGWRALLSPVDGSGAQVIWFVKAEEDNAPGKLFGVLTQDPAGIVLGFGSQTAPMKDLPPAQPIGSQHGVPQAEGLPPLALLEAPFEAGRRAVRDALELHWTAKTTPPLEYQLLNPLIWSAAPCSAASEPELAPAITAHTAALLDHPAFASWLWYSADLQETARQLGRRHDAAARRAQVIAVADAQFGPEVVASYRRRLAAMTRWLALAGQPEAAALAQIVVEQLALAPAAESPFVRRLIGNGIDLALSNQRRRFDGKTKR